MKGKLISDPKELLLLASKRKSVYDKVTDRGMAAAWLIHMQFITVMKALKTKQIYTYVNEKK